MASRSSTLETVLVVTEKEGKSERVTVMVNTNCPESNAKVDIGCSHCLCS